MSTLASSKTELSAPTDPVVAAQRAQLRYVSDSVPGIARKAVRGGFRYLTPDGKPLRDKRALARIKSLVIPPAWRDVWISPWEDGHIQVTARDARQRKQYRYHTKWRTVRDEVKYGRMIEFGKALPALRASLEKALALPGLPREKVLATVVTLLESTMMRIGNDEYARTNHSYGLTTLRNQHVQFASGEVRFNFRGKSGVQHAISLRDPRLARIIKRMRDLPGQDLFQYQDDEGNTHAIGSADVNDYLRDLMGEDYTAKDFRTWSGTVLAAVALHECAPCGDKADAKKNIVQVIAQVAKKLGNTPAVCRKCYVHPVVLDAYLNGLLHEKWPKATHAVVGLREHDEAVLALLERGVEAFASEKKLPCPKTLDARKKTRPHKQAEAISPNM